MGSGLYYILWACGGRLFLKPGSGCTLLPFVEPRRTNALTRNGGHVTLFRTGRRRLFLVAAAAAGAALLGGAGGGLLGVCGPFTDVSDPSFCPFVLEIFTLGITTGTTPTTYSPGANVSRLQMAAFLSRTVDNTLQRSGRRAALDQFWTPRTAASLGLTTVGGGASNPACDGADVWVANHFDSTVSRVRASDGRLLETWTGAGGVVSMLAAMGKIFATGFTSPGALYRIDPTQPAGAVTTVASNLGNIPNSIAFDGGRIWTADEVPGGVSIITPGASIPWTVTTVTAGFANLQGIVYDGANIWVTDYGVKTLLKLNAGGAILQTVTLSIFPGNAIFDGTNIWVLSPDSSIAVVRASSGVILATLTGNGMSDPVAAGFDGQRVLVANDNNESVSLWKAADLTPLGSTPTGTGSSPEGVCSDGINFWIPLIGTNKLARF